MEIKELELGQISVIKINLHYNSDHINQLSLDPGIWTCNL